MQMAFENFGGLMSQNIVLAIIIALTAGVVASFGPCSIATIPLIIGYVSKEEGKNKRSPLIYSLVFSIGVAITFTILGILSSTIGRIFIGIGNYLYIILGIIMLIVGLQMIDIINFRSKSCKVSKKGKGIFGVFLLGILGGVISSPCATPVLIAILAFVAQKGNILLGGLLLFVYSIGHCVIILIAGTSTGLAQKLISSSKNNKTTKILKYLFAIIIMLFGFYLLYLGF